MEGSDEVKFWFNGEKVDCSAGEETIDCKTPSTIDIYAILENDIIQSCLDIHDESCIYFLICTSAFIQSMCIVLAFSWSLEFIICMDCILRWH